MGRPLKSSEPKNISLHLRLTQQEAERIKMCSEQTGQSRTDVIMQGIGLLEKELKKNVSLLTPLKVHTNSQTRQR